MEHSFEIKKDNKIKKEIERYTNLITELKTERDILLERHCKAVFEDDEINSKKYLLKLSANSLLMDAYKLGLMQIEMELKGV